MRMRNMKAILSKMADATTRVAEDEEFGDSSEDEEIEYRRLKATHEAAGYRVGLTEGEERFLQEGFNKGFIHSSRINSCWSQLRGVLCALILYAESEKADELSLQLGNLLKELKTTQQQKVKETLAGQGTVQACYGKGVGEETAQRSCVGQGGGENVQGCCVGQGGRGSTQGCCRDQGGHDCKVNAESERMTNENLHDQSHIEEQANCTRSNQSDEDHCQTHDYAGRCCDKGHLTTYAPSPTLTELWTRCSDIARQLGLSEEDLREIRKLTGAIIVC